MSAIHKPTRVNIKTLLRELFLSLLILNTPASSVTTAAKKVSAITIFRINIGSSIRPAMPIMQAYVV